MTSTRRCAACKYLRRRCASNCIFSPYFPSNNPQRFAYVHRIYGASNVGKMLQQLPVNLRAEAADSLYYEAQCRIEDRVYGCVGIITLLHQQIHNAQSQLAKTQAQIALLNAHAQAEETQYQQIQPIAPSFNSILSDQNGIGPSSFYDPTNAILSDQNGVGPSSFYDPTIAWFYNCV